MRRFVCSISLFFLSNLVLLVPAGAEDRRGAISGMVTDAGHGVLTMAGESRARILVTWRLH